MKPMAAIIPALALAACATAASVDGGVANYDELKKAQAACAAKGGDLALKPMGDSQYIADYACKRN
ncbi:MAG: hypothetical protein JWM33_765 [Caulobacteraceae bacterium]|nr:hypothetical protein [Caulobacteraceae bacterium]